MRRILFWVWSAQGSSAYLVNGRRSSRYSYCSQQRGRNICSAFIEDRYLDSHEHLLGSLAYTFALSFDSKILGTVLESGGFVGLHRYLEINRLAWSDGVRTVLTSVVAIYLLNELRKRFGISGEAVENDGRLFITGLGIGALVSSVVCVFQVLEISPFTYLNQNPFWVFVGRKNATFSDPNAFALMGSFIVPLLLLWPGDRRTLRIVSALVLFLVLPFSGSRTAWLAFAIWGLVAVVIRQLSDNLPRSRFRISAFVLAALLLLALLTVPRVNVYLQRNIPVSGVTRFLQTIHFEQSSGMLESRATFWRLAVHVWRDSPLVGVGVGRFIDVQKGYAERFGLKDWRDNANNFYLQLLAETGIVGLLAGLVAIVLIWKVVSLKGSVGPLAQPALFVLLLLLFTGPHLAFDELCFLFAILIAFSATTFKIPGVIFAAKMTPGIFYRSTGLVFGAAYLAIPICLLSPVTLNLSALSHSGLTSTHGLYPTERDEAGRLVAWTAKNAEIELCGESDTFDVRMRATQPDIASRPLWVNVQLEDAKNRERKVASNAEISDTNWRTISLTLPRTSLPAHRKTLHLEASRVWSPKLVGLGEDSRYLGVMVQIPDSVCAVP